MIYEPEASFLYTLNSGRPAHLRRHETRAAHESELRRMVAANVPGDWTALDDDNSTRKSRFVWLAAGIRLALQKGKCKLTKCKMDTAEDFMTLIHSTDDRGVPNTIVRRGR